MATNKQERKMRRVALSLMILGLCLGSALWGQPATRSTVLLEPVDSPEELEQRFPRLRAIEIPEVASHTLANGMQVYLLEDHTLPIVSGVALIRTGNLFDPPEKVSLAEITGSVLRVGGTKTRSGEEIDQELESMAASVETGIGETSGQANFWTLKEHADRVLAIYADVLMNPAFRQDKVEFIKQQIRSRIARRNDEPGSIANREFNNLIYGKQSPYGWQIEYEHVNRIQREDLVGFYERFFFPANVMLGVYGDFDSEEMKQKLEQAFQDWTVQRDPAPPFPEVQVEPSGGTYLVVKEDVNQSNIRIGHLGGVLNEEDYPALEVMGQILGGGFQSRLFQRVRSNLGLAYDARAHWGANYNHPGVFRVALATKSETTVKAIQASLQEIRRLREETVTEAELRDAKESILNSFVFNFDTKRKTLGRLLRYRYWGYPDDFIFRYRERIQGVTAEDVLRVAKQRIRPDDLKLVVVGKPADFDQPLDVLGKPVTELDIAIPLPEEEKAAATADTLEKGSEILARARRAAGGAEKLAAVKDITRRIKMQGAQPMFSGQQTTLIILPDVLRQENQLPFGKIIVFVDGASGWMQTPQGRMPLPPPQLRQSRDALFRLRETVLLSDRDPERTVNFVEEDHFDGRLAQVIEISAPDGRSVRLWVDASSGDVLKSAYKGAALQGPPADVEEVYADFRDVDGLRVPFKVTILQNGSKFLEAEVLEVEYNSGIRKEDLASP